MLQVGHPFAEELRSFPERRVRMAGVARFNRALRLRK